MVDCVFIHAHISVQTFGFPLDLCIRALRTVGDDSNLAVVYLLEGGNVQGDDLFDGLLDDDQVHVCLLSFIS